MINLWLQVYFMRLKKKSAEKIKNSLLIISPTHLKDNLIQSYDDFTKNRIKILNSKFSKNIFLKIVDFTNEYWSTEKKISRLNLVKTIHDYGLKNKFNLRKLKAEERLKLFNLFKNSIENFEYVTPLQLPIIRKYCSKLIQGLSFSEEAETWLCKKALSNPLILERVLNYPQKSIVLNSWVSENFFNDQLRPRRNELVSFKLDENPDYFLDPQLLIDDFYAINRLDRERIIDYENEIKVDDLLNEELKEIFPDQHDFPTDLQWLQDDLGINLSHHHKIEFINRGYPVPLRYSSSHKFPIPNFNYLKVYFDDNFTSQYYSTLLWAIYYSRLEIKTKEKLLVQYFTEETMHIFLLICKRLKLKKPLKEVLKKYNAEKNKKKVGRMGI